MPQSMKVICQGAFFDCQSLRKATLNEGLKVLGTDQYPKENGLWNGVFEQSGLRDIELPSTLKIIEYSAFKNCKAL